MQVDRELTEVLRNKCFYRRVTTLNIQVAGSSEIMVEFCQTANRNISADRSCISLLELVGILNLRFLQFILNAKLLLS
jgi:hypothetical protein